MLVLRCTKELAQSYNLGLSEQPLPSGNDLGDWYATMVASAHGEWVAFVNAISRLVVVCPKIEIGDLLLIFKERLGHLLDDLGLIAEDISAELAEMTPVCFGEAIDRPVMDSMGFIVWHIQSKLGHSSAVSQDLLLEIEKELAEMPNESIMPGCPADVVRNLLGASNTVH